MVQKYCTILMFMLVTALCISCSLIPNHKKTDPALIDLTSTTPAWEQPLLCQAWDLTDNDGETMDLKPSPVILFSTLHIFPGGKMTLATTDSLIPGTWSMKEDDITLHFKGYASCTMSVLNLKEHKLRVSFKNGQSNQKITFTSDGTVHKTPENDPWYPVNNAWRIKPRQPETDAQIKERVKNYMNFLALFLRDNHQRGKEEVDWKSIPTVIGFYGNGISLYSESKIEESWESCFYSDEQAMQAYNMIKDVRAGYCSMPVFARAWRRG